MEFLKNLSPIRKHNLYSSQRHLVDAEASHYTDNDDDTSIKHEKIKKSPTLFPKTYLKMKNFPSIPAATDDSSEKSISLDLPLQKSVLVNKTSRETSLKVLDEKNSLEELITKGSPVLISSLSESSTNSGVVLIKSANNLSIENNVSLNQIEEAKSKFSNRSVKSEEDIKIKKTRSKRKSPNKDISDNEEIELTPLEIKGDTESIKRVLTIIGVHVLKCDILKNHPFLIYPFVRIHIVNTDNEECINLKHQNLISTKSFDFVKQRTIIPQWNELILFENKIIEDINNTQNILILFEIMDIESTTVNKKDNNKADNEKEQTISWAFIKPFRHDGKTNMNRKIKLQLYELSVKNDSKNLPTVYNYWKDKLWKIYPSVLYVTLKGIKIQEKQDFINNIKLNILKNLPDEKETNIAFFNSRMKLESVPNYDIREGDQQCKIPNRIIKCLSKETGPFVIKFSPCGKYLAYTANSCDDYVIFVYKIPKFEREMQLSYHKKNIYDICWSHSRNFLMSASADCTVCVWDLSNKKLNLVQKLTHPAFVYSSQLCSLDETLVTGCYDKVIRIWLNMDSEYKLNQELLGHEGFINSICFVKKSKTFYSGDNTGVIIKWNNDNQKWYKMLTIKNSELIDHIINDLIMFPDNGRMLVVIRNSTSWVLDIATSTPLLCFKDGFEYMYQLRGALSPCGSLVFIGNCVWDSSTGKLLAIYNPSVFHHHSVTALDFHPCYNFIAMGCGFLQSPLLICDFQQNHLDLNINMELYKNISYINKPSNYVQDEDENDTEENVSKDKKLDSSKTLHLKEVVPGNVGLKGLIERGRDSKLWNLINKMDDVLLIARKGREFAEKKSNAFKNEESIVYKKEEKYNSALLNKTDSESNTTISVDLTHFNKVFQLQADVHEQQIEDIDDVKNECTFTIDKDDDNVIQILDDSSTLSAAESLEDDLHTYTISINDNVANNITFNK